MWSKQFSRMALSNQVSAVVLLLLLLWTQVLAQNNNDCSVGSNNVTINENNLPGAVVTTITMAPDITVTIDPNSPNPGQFDINGTELILIHSLDYENENVLLVILLCKQGDIEVNSVEIIVQVGNLNDNSPVFKQTNITVNVPEDTAVNTIIIGKEQLTASDGDQDIIRYELTGVTPEAADYFSIGGVNNPEILLRKALDYEKYKFMQLLLYARDREPSNTATATINIDVKQADTRPPWFQPCTFVNADKKVCIPSSYIGRVNISEKTTEPLVLKPGPLFAIDPDYTFNEKIVYSIVSGNKDDIFLLNSDTGNLTMNKAANTTDTFILHVMATQVNNAQRYSLATVEIKVIAKSEYPPNFTNSGYKGTVSAGLAAFSLVMESGAPSKPLKIFAADNDFPNKYNPQITYSIQNSSDFTVTRDGLVLTNKLLESAANITVSATATDEDSLQEAKTNITVEVTPSAGTTPPPPTTTTSAAGSGTTIPKPSGSSSVSPPGVTNPPSTVNSGPTESKSPVNMATDNAGTSASTRRPVTGTSSGSIVSPFLTTVKPGATNLPSTVNSGPTESTSPVNVTTNNAGTSGPTGRPVTGTSSGSIVSTFLTTTKPDITKSTTATVSTMHPVEPSESGTIKSPIPGTNPATDGTVSSTALPSSPSGGPISHPPSAPVPSSSPRPSDSVSSQTSFTNHQTGIQEKNMNPYSAQDMAALGAPLAVLLAISLLLLGLIVYKNYGNSLGNIIKCLPGKANSKDPFKGVSNKGYQDDENPIWNTKDNESLRSDTSENATPVMQQESDGFPPLEPAVESSIATASAAIKDGEKDKEGTDMDSVKEVKSILTKDRKMDNAGYKAVWFRDDIDPDTKDDVVVIEDHVTEEDASDGDRDKNEEDEQDSQHGDPVASFIPEKSQLQATDVNFKPDQGAPRGDAGEDIFL